MQTNKERKVQEAVLNIKNKFGKNEVLRGISLEKKATAKRRTFIDWIMILKIIH